MFVSAGAFALWRVSVRVCVRAFMQMHSAPAAHVYVVCLLVCVPVCCVCVCVLVCVQVCVCVCVCKCV